MKLCERSTSGGKPLYHFINVARVNSYLMFTDWKGKGKKKKKKKREKKPDIPELEHPKSLGQLDFTVELIKESGGIDKNTEVPLYSLKKPQPPLPPPPPLQTRALLPKWSEKYKNCKCCYSRKKKEKKTYVTCATCEQHFYCFTTKRNCLGAAHQ